MNSHNHMTSVATTTGFHVTVSATSSSILTHRFQNATSDHLTEEPEDPAAHLRAQQKYGRDAQAEKKRYKSRMNELLTPDGWHLDRRGRFYAICKLAEHLKVGASEVNTKTSQQCDGDLLVALFVEQDRGSTPDNMAQRLPNLAVWINEFFPLATTIRLAIFYSTPDVQAAKPVPEGLDYLLSTLKELGYKAVCTGADTEKEDEFLAFHAVEQAVFDTIELSPESLKTGILTPKHDDQVRVEPTPAASEPIDVAFPKKDDMVWVPKQRGSKLL